MADRIEIDFKALGYPETPRLGRYDYREAKVGLSSHDHTNVMEICYLAKGRQMYRVKDTDYVLSGNEIFITFPGETHSTGGAPQEKGILYWFHVAIPKKGGRFLNCSPDLSASLIEHLLKLPNRHFAGVPSMRVDLDEMISASSRVSDPLQRIYLQNRFLDFILKIIECSGKQPRSTVTPQISTLLRYIESNVHQSLPLGSLAARLGLSLPRFKARFKSEVGIPPAEYVLRCKVSEAKKRLLAPRSTVLDVALDLNFSSSQYFATVFRRYTGQTASTFRRAMARSGP